VSSTHQTYQAHQARPAYQTRQASPTCQTLPVLCENADGYRNLCRLITRMKMRAPKGEGALALDELEGMTGGLVVLAGRVALNAHRFGVGGLLDRLVGLFGRDRIYVELQRHLRRDEEADPDDREVPGAHGPTPAAPSASRPPPARWPGPRR